MVLPLIIGIISGAIVGVVAEQKNRPFFPWAVYGFLLFFIAIIHLAALGDRKYEEDELKKLGYVKCPSCTKWVKSEGSICGHCGTALQETHHPSASPPAETAVPGEKKLCRWCKEHFKEEYGNKCPACGGLQIHFLRDNPLLIALILCLMLAYLVIFSQFSNDPFAPTTSKPPTGQSSEF